MITNTAELEQRESAALQFVEQYGVTPSFFVGFCLLPALLAVTRLSCLYRGVLVETLESPAWKTRLRALRTVFAWGLHNSPQLLTPFSKRIGAE